MDLSLQSLWILQSVFSTVQLQFFYEERIRNKLLNTFHAESTVLSYNDTDRLHSLDYVDVKIATKEIIWFENRI